ncbi:hypothetical protein [Sphingomonas montanisoli]|uniref:Uncharacterized protein n=1 Tax=Sphingomonas montanisoli TaxID=2606412 RepID=A0A5D9C2X5_9SPHN|nr:hypothetical protein [Sphingomonas montanisoli]TZG25622.1 hypothetical protein FYJ91_11390 [Sphingomonas montanisoli]
MNDMTKLKKAGLAPTVGEILNESDEDRGARERAAAATNAPTAFDEIRQEIEDLYENAKQYLDGEGIQTEEQAADVGKLRDMIRDAAKRADGHRKDEAAPFDAGKAEVQARYNPLIQKDRGKTDLAIAACNDALKPYLHRVEREQQAAAAKARAEADALAREARQHAAIAADSGDLSKREAADAVLGEAKNAAKHANRMEQAKPQAAGLKKAIGMKSVYRPEFIDPAAALAHYRQTRPAALKEWLIEQARADIRAGHKTPDAIPGFKVIEDRVPA